MMYYVACGLALVATLSSLGCSPRIKRQELSTEAQQQLSQSALQSQLIEEELLLELPDSLDLVPPLASRSLPLALGTSSPTSTRSPLPQGRLYYRRRTRAAQQQASATTQHVIQQQLRQEPRRAPQPLLPPLGLALGAGLGAYLSYRVRRALR